MTLVMGKPLWSGDVFWMFVNDLNHSEWFALVLPWYKNLVFT